jgi:AcrR family transcriptional regulator
MTDNRETVKDASTGASFQLLLQTAERLIEEKGCRRTTLQEIMNETGLSKGAIYHYVSSKDELFGLVLRERLNAVNDRFFEAVKRSGNLTDPLRAIAQMLEQLHDEKDVTSRILIYLLIQRDNPVIERMLAEFYEKHVNLSIGWIETGQQAGVISPEVDARKTGELFVLISYGMRVRGMAVSNPGNFSADDMYELMRAMLERRDMR